MVVDYICLPLVEGQAPLIFLGALFVPRLMPNKPIALSRVDPKYTKILYSPHKSPKRKKGGLGMVQGYFILPTFKRYS